MLLCNLSWPGTCYVALAGLRLTEILPNARIKGMSYHTQPTTKISVMAGRYQGPQILDEKYNE